MTLHLQRKDDKRIIVTVYEGSGRRADITRELRMTEYHSLYSAFCDEQELNHRGRPIAWNFYAWERVLQI